MIDLWGNIDPHIQHSIALLKEHEPPELVYFIRKNYPDVIRHLPKKTMWQLIYDNGIPPLRNIRYCCRILKEVGGKGRTVITGIRRAESPARANRQEIAELRKSLMVSPILHWSTQQVWGYIHKYNLPYYSLYDEGFSRIGCVMCPCSGPTGMKKDALRWPKIADAYRRACVKSFDKIINDSWKDGNDMYEWWISGKTFGKEPTLWDESE